MSYNSKKSDLIILDYDWNKEIEKSMKEIEKENDKKFQEEINKKRISTKKDWLDILKNEEQENNIILEILFYMMGCKNYTSNGLNIMKALNLNGIPNSEIASFGKRIIKLKGIKEQEGRRSHYRYWNIPFTSDFSKNKKNLFTWKIREELVEALIEKYNLIQYKVDTIEEQFNEHLEMLSPNEYAKRIEEDLKIRSEFVDKFNINYIINMSLNDFVSGRSTIDEEGKNSFCYLLEFKMMNLGDMRGATVEKFGVWFSKEKNNYLFLEKYGLSLEDAFVKLKEELCRLIIAGNNDDYNVLDKSMLPPLFKGKVLSTYFPDKYLCIFKEDDIDKFLYTLGISYDINEVNTLEKKKRLLKEYKNNHPLFSKYTDYYFVIFLYNTFKKELKEHHTVNGEIDCEFELVEFDYLGVHQVEKKLSYRSRETDYERINKNKKDIGNRGENAVIKYEKNNLMKLGLNKLAEKVELSENDAIGYDILSFDENGNEKHIEVKTNSASSNKLMEFYLTDNELNKMNEDSCYYIYYLYSIKNKPKIHIINKEKLLQQQEIYFKPILYKIAIDVERK